MTSISSSSGTSIALAGMRQAEQTQLVAIKAMGSGSLDMDAMAQVAALLAGAQSQESASSIALVANLRQQSMFIDILA